MAAKLENLNRDRGSRTRQRKGESIGKCKLDLQTLVHEKQVLKALCKLAMALIIDSLTGMISKYDTESGFPHV